MKKQMQTVGCPKSMVGRVIGKNGETIRALQNYSGALIQIDQSTDPMKVTISGTTESVGLAMSMVTDIVNGTFKGFAMLRQVTNEQAKGDATVCQPVYAPGYGLIPPSQQLFTAASMADAQATVGMSPHAAGLGAIPSSLPSFMESQVKPQFIPTSSFLAGMGNTFDKLSLGTNGFAQAAQLPATGASGSTSLNGFSSFDLLGSGTFSQCLTESPMHTSAALPSIGDLVLSLPESTLPMSLLARDHLNLAASFPADLPKTGGISSPLSGTLSPELSCGWAAGLNPNSAHSPPVMGHPSIPQELGLNALPSARSDQATNIQNYSQFLKASGAGSSYSDVSDTADHPNTSRLSPRSTNTASNNVIVLEDPSGRPFAMDLITGERQWLNDVAAGHSMLHACAAATIN